ncbi:hypothetical protein FB005_12110 [Sinorhizobium medicae]|nr:hypothetical protein FB005_12110 [Sinorhizobium medicae]
MNGSHALYNPASRSCRRQANCCNQLWVKPVPNVFRQVFPVGF